MILTKKQAADMSLRPFIGHISNDILSKVVDKIITYPNYIFIKELRKSTNLNFCAFGPGTYIIKD